MTTALTNTLYGLTGKYNLDEIYTEELAQLVKDYPYFAPAQIALAAKYKSQGHVSTQTQIQKTGLYVSNTKWLQFQLMDLSSVSFAKEKATQSSSNNNLLPSIDIPTIEDVKQMMGDNSVQAEIGLQESFTNTLEQVQEVEFEAHVPKIESIVQEEPFTPQPIEVIPETPIQQENVIEELVVEQNIEPVTPEIQEHPTFISFEEPVISKEEIEATKFVPEESIEGEPEFPEPLETTPIDEPANDIHAQIARLKEQWHKPIQPDEKLAFEAEPYYTIDYFESQGIKFDYKNNTNDDLTKKMLKFTDWLKRMKNPNASFANQNQENGEELDKAIQGIAQASNQPKEIVTETMAEVFEKQGDIEKAIQLYIKLSFLNPNKTAFFAARIQKLKGI